MSDGYSLATDLTPGQSVQVLETGNLSRSINELKKLQLGSDHSLCVCPTKPPVGSLPSTWTPCIFWDQSFPTLSYVAELEDEKSVAEIFHQNMSRQRPFCHHRTRPTSLSPTRSALGAAFVSARELRRFDTGDKDTAPRYW